MKCCSGDIATAANGESWGILTGDLQKSRQSCIECGYSIAEESDSNHLGPLRHLQKTSWQKNCINTCHGREPSQRTFLTIAGVSQLWQDFIVVAVLLRC